MSLASDAARHASTIARPGARDQRRRRRAARGDRLREARYRRRRGLRQSDRALLSARRRGLPPARRRVDALNWSATNTSYVERDEDAAARLRRPRRRSFDRDRRTGRCRRSGATIASCCRCCATATSPTIRPCARSSTDRATSASPSTRGCSSRGRRSSRRYAQRSTTGRAAAVVIDPDTGDLLAVVELSVPVADGAAHGAPATWTTRCSIARATGSIRRARPSSSSRPPPRSRRDLGASSADVHLRRLPDGRVGARIPGWSRPVRDDVLDTHPHGTIDMHDGLVHSCNAYFAQLARARRAARRCSTRPRALGISVRRRTHGRAPARHAAAGRLRPGRRGRHAAAHGAGGGGDRHRRHAPRRVVGRRRQARGGRRTAAAARDARLLARYMRDACSTAPAARSAVIRAASPARPAPRKSAARRRTPGSSASRRTARRPRRWPSPSSSRTPATAAAAAPSRRDRHRRFRTRLDSVTQMDILSTARRLEAALAHASIAPPTAYGPPARANRSKPCTSSCRRSRRTSSQADAAGMLWLLGHAQTSATKPPVPPHQDPVHQSIRTARQLVSPPSTSGRSPPPRRSGVSASHFADPELSNAALVLRWYPQRCRARRLLLWEARAGVYSLPHRMQTRTRPARPTRPNRM